MIINIKKQETGASVRKFILGFPPSALACTGKVGPLFAKSYWIPA
jgi:hypothetical protein